MWLLARPAWPGDWIRSTLNPGLVLKVIDAMLDPSQRIAAGFAAPDTPMSARGVAGGAIAGIDETEALRRYDGDADMLRRALSAFVSIYEAGLGEELDSAMAADDSATVRRVAHTLKGAAGAIGATALSAEAWQLESASAARPPTVQLEQQVERLKLSLGVQTHAIRERLESEASAPAPPPAPEPVWPDLDRFERMLAVGDFGAMALHQQLSPLLRERYGEAATRIARALQQLDFERAWRELRASRRA